MNDIQQRLRNNNPFASVSSPFPWENNNPDIAQLNRDVSEEIEQLIRQKRREPSVPLAGLVLGEIGCGKTHMMMRILRRLKDNEQPAIFAAVKAFRNPKGVMQHILSEIFINLKLTHSKGRSQFDILAEGIAASYEEQRAKDGFNDISSLDMRKYLSRDLPRLDRNFLRCILMYLSTDDDFTRADIVEWLRDGLDYETSESLGLPIKDTNSMTEGRREELAEETLISLGIAMGYAKIPMVVCFDQLDNMDSPELVRAWGEVVGLMVNDLSGILPLCFLKADTWEDKFRPALDPAIVQRLEHRKMKMKGCTVALARKLIHEKIAVLFGTDTEEVYEWLLSKMGNILIDGLSPRKVVMLASETITDSTLPEDVIRSAYNEEYRKVQDTPYAWPPNADNLILALEVWLSSLDGFTVSRTKDNKYIGLTGLHGSKRFAFIVLTAKGHSTVSAALKAGMSFMKEYPGSECYYITEDKTHKKTWKQANENLRKFESEGGRSLILSKDSRISWYALTALINRIDNGDVNIYTASQSRPAKRSDMAAFLHTLKLIDSRSLKFSPVSVTYPPSTPKTPPKVYYDDKLFADTLMSILTASPVKIITADKAASLLSQRGIKAGRNEVIAFVKNNTEKFRTYSSKSQDILITLADKS